MDASIENQHMTSLWKNWPSKISYRHIDTAFVYGVSLLGLTNGKTTTYNLDSVKMIIVGDEGLLSCNTEATVLEA